MRHFLGDAFFKERRKLTAEGKSFPHGRMGWTRTSGIQESKSCALPLGYHSIYRVTKPQPHSSFGRLCDLYINPSNLDATGGPGHFCQP